MMINIDTFVMVLTPASIFLFVNSSNVSPRILMLLRSMRVTRGSTVGEEYRVLRLESITKVKSVSREGLDNIISTTVQRTDEDGSAHQFAGKSDRAILAMMNSLHSAILQTSMNITIVHETIEGSLQCHLLRPRRSCTGLLFAS